MKSVIAQGSSIAKAIEEALKKADMPQEFFVKVLEDAQAGFLGFGSKKAKIALFFKNEVISEKTSQGMFEKGSYAGLFNNPDLKKQLDQQLKELGFEIKPLEVKKSPEFKKQEIKPKSFKKDFAPTPLKVSNLQIRPLGNKNQTQQSSVIKKDIFADLSSEEGSFKDQSSQDQQDSKQGQSKRRYYRYRRNRYKNRSNGTDGADQNSFDSNKLGASDKDE